MFGDEVKDYGLRYFGVELPARHNVREPMPKPILKLITVVADCVRCRWTRRSCSTSSWRPPRRWT